MPHREHLWHYLVLVFILAAGFWGFISFPLAPSRRFLSLFASIVGYILWAVWHHYVENRLSWLVISEYLLLALVVSAMATLLIFPI